MDELDFLTQYYTDHNEDARFLSKHGQVEYLTTTRYINKYLKPGMRILEVGAGTGRYSIALAKLGCQVDAIELVQHNIDVFKSKLTGDENITVRQGTAQDLSFFEDETFDITLNLGPMYHLFSPIDKIKALAESLRVTKRGGLVFVAYCISDATIVDYGFRGGDILAWIQKGLVDLNTFKTRSNPSEIFELYRKEDIDELMAGLNVTRLHYVATDLFTKHMRATMDSMNDETFDLYLKYHFSICERPDMVGITHHSLDILRKN
jgi:ubiquinone/menaquinone biosynthesis C-methylase UbiE